MKEFREKGSGMVIFLNGASSSGKSTIAGELQTALAEVFLYVSVDAFLNQLPEASLSDQEYFSRALPNLLAGFNASSAAIARAGSNIIVDHVLQEPSWVLPCVRTFEGIEVVFVGVHCPLDLLEEREKARGDRHIGLARYQYDRVHSHNTYDIEVDTSEMNVDECVSVIRKYVESGKRPAAFRTLSEMPDD